MLGFARLTDGCNRPPDKTHANGRPSEMPPLPHHRRREITGRSQLLAKSAMSRHLPSPGPFEYSMPSTRTGSARLSSPTASTSSSDPRVFLPASLAIETRSTHWPTRRAQHSSPAILALVVCALFSPRLLRLIVSAPPSESTPLRPSPAAPRNRNCPPRPCSTPSA